MNKLGLSICGFVFALAGCQEDSEEEPRCDPELDGTICTIAGNGENEIGRAHV